MGKQKDLTGVRFGRLVAKYVARIGKDTSRIWRCDCDCGKSVDVVIGSLTSGNTRSCGCLKKERCVKWGKSRKTHGRCAIPHRSNYDRTYWAWSKMVARCTKPENKDYKYYGARGIGVCDSWLAFDAFLKDMGECPSYDSLTLERKDNSKGYSPENCEWASRAAQSRNRRGLKLTQEKANEIRRDKRKAKEIAKSYNVSVSTIFRVRRGEIWA